MKQLKALPSVNLGSYDDKTQFSSNMNPSKLESSEMALNVARTIDHTNRSQQMINQPLGSQRLVDNLRNK